MQKENDESSDVSPFAEAEMSEELKQAIQSLIAKMREEEPTEMV